MDLQESSSYNEGEEKRNFVISIQHMMVYLKQLETAKVDLALRSDFNLVDSFRMMDQNSKGWITATEVREKLCDLGMNPSQEDIHLFMRRYDRD